MNRTTSLRAAVATVVAAAASLAQEPATAPHVGRGLVTPIHTQADDRGVPYGLWAAGDDYKASFAGTMTFVPYGATDGPAPNWSWRTASARIGERELVQHPAVLRHCELRAEYDLGDVVEAYDVRAAGLEQTFVVARHPGGAGDLVIRGAVTSALQPAADARDAGIAWLDAHGDVRVRYGAAVAIDANGRRREMATTPVAGGLELRLDAGWLATAAFPLIVDPLLSPVIVSGGTTIAEVAVAHDPLGTKGLWLAEVRRVGTDSDLRLIRADADGGAPVLVYSDLSASWATIEPSLGINRPAASTVVAFTRNFFFDDTREIRVHVHDRLDLGVDTSYVVVPNASGRNQHRPAVGSDLSPVSFTSLLIAYQVEGTGAFSNISTSAIHGLAFACGGTGSVQSQFVISEVAGVDCERPTVSNVAVGPTRTWTVGYQRYQPFGTNGFNWDVSVRRVDAAFAVSVETFIDNGIASQHEMAPKLAGNDNRLMLFYTASTVAESISKPIGINGHRIRGMRLDWNFGWMLTYGSRLLQSNNDARLEIAGAAFDTISQSHWALSFRSNATEALYLRTYGYAGLELTSDTVHTPTVALGTTIAGGVAFQANDDEFLVGYGADEPGVGSYLKLRQRTWPAIGGVSTTGTSCTTTQLGWDGTRWIGSEQSSLTFQNAPAGSLTLAIVATQTASLQIFGVGGVLDGCWLLVPLAGPDYLGMLGAIVGTNGSWTLPLPEALDSMVLRFQAITLDPSSGLFTSSSRLSVPIVK